MTWLVTLRAQCDAIHPQLWFLVVAGVVGAIVFAWRKANAASWNKLPSRLKVLPATIIGALLAATSDDKAGTVIVNAMLGAFSGLTAAGGHEMLVRLFTGAGDNRPARKKKPKKDAEDKPADKPAESIQDGAEEASDK